MAAGQSAGRIQRPKGFDASLWKTFIVPNLVKINDLVLENAQYGVNTFVRPLGAPRPPLKNRVKKIQNRGKRRKHPSMDGVKKLRTDCAIETNEDVSDSSSTDESSSSSSSSESSSDALNIHITYGPPGAQQQRNFPRDRAPLYPLCGIVNPTFHSTSSGEDDAEFEAADNHMTFGDLDPEAHGEWASNFQAGEPHYRTVSLSDDTSPPVRRRVHHRQSDGDTPANSSDCGLTQDLFIYGGDLSEYFESLNNEDSDEVEEHFYSCADTSHPDLQAVTSHRLLSRVSEEDEEEDLGISIDEDVVLRIVETGDESDAASNCVEICDIKTLSDEKSEQISCEQNAVDIKQTLCDIRKGYSELYSILCNDTSGLAETKSIPSKRVKVIHDINENVKKAKSLGCMNERLHVMTMKLESVAEHASNARSPEEERDVARDIKSILQQTQHLEELLCFDYEHTIIPASKIEKNVANDKAKAVSHTAYQPANGLSVEHQTKPFSMDNEWEEANNDPKMFGRHNLEESDRTIKSVPYMGLADLELTTQRRQSDGGSQVSPRLASPQILKLDSDISQGSLSVQYSGNSVLISPRIKTVAALQPHEVVEVRTVPAVSLVPSCDIDVKQLDIEQQKTQAVLSSTPMKTTFDSGISNDELLLSPVSSENDQNDEKKIRFEQRENRQDMGDKSPDSGVCTVMHGILKNKYDHNEISPTEYSNSPVFGSEENLDFTNTSKSLCDTKDSTAEVENTDTSKVEAANEVEMKTHNKHIAANFMDESLKRRSNASDTLKATSPWDKMQCNEEKTASLSSLLESTLQRKKHHKLEYSHNPEAAFLSAARDGKLGRLRHLLAKNVDVNACSGWMGDTALHVAARWNQVTIVRELIKHGADVNLTNQWGATPLHAATAEGNLNPTLLLLWADADPTIPDKWGHTPMQQSLRRGDYNITKQLMEANTQYVDAGSVKGSKDSLAILVNAIEEKENRPQSEVLQTTTPFDAEGIKSASTTALPVGSSQSTFEKPKGRFGKFWKMDGGGKRKRHSSLPLDKSKEKNYKTSSSLVSRRLQAVGNKLRLWAITSASSSDSNQEDLGSPLKKLGNASFKKGERVSSSEAKNNVEGDSAKDFYESQIDNLDKLDDPDMKIHSPRWSRDDILLEDASGQSWSVHKEQVEQLKMASETICDTKADVESSQCSLSTTARDSFDSYRLKKYAEDLGSLVEFLKEFEDSHDSVVALQDAIHNANSEAQRQRFDESQSLQLLPVIKEKNCYHHKSDSAFNTMQPAANALDSNNADARELACQVSSRQQTKLSSSTGTANNIKTNEFVSNTTCELVTSTASIDKAHVLIDAAKSELLNANHCEMQANGGSIKKASPVQTVKADVHQSCDDSDNNDSNLNLAGQHTGTVSHVMSTAYHTVNQSIDFGISSSEEEPCEITTSGPQQKSYVNECTVLLSKPEAEFINTEWNTSMKSDHDNWNVIHEESQKIHDFIIASSPKRQLKTEPNATHSFQRPKSGTEEYWETLKNESELVASAILSDTEEDSPSKNKKAVSKPSLTSNSGSSEEQPCGTRLGNEKSSKTAGFILKPSWEQDSAFANHASMSPVFYLQDTDSKTEEVHERNSPLLECASGNTATNEFEDIPVFNEQEKHEYNCDSLDEILDASGTGSWESEDEIPVIDETNMSEIALEENKELSQIGMNERAAQAIKMVNGFHSKCEGHKMKNANGWTENSENTFDNVASKRKLDSYLLKPSKRVIAASDISVKMAGDNLEIHLSESGHEIIEEEEEEDDEEISGCQKTSEPFLQLMEIPRRGSHGRQNENQFNAIDDMWKAKLEAQTGSVEILPPESDEDQELKPGGQKVALKSSSLPKDINQMWKDKIERCENDSRIEVLDSVLEENLDKNKSNRNQKRLKHFKSPDCKVS